MENLGGEKAELKLVTEIDLGSGIPVVRFGRYRLQKHWIFTVCTAGSQGIQFSDGLFGTGC